MEQVCVYDNKLKFQHSKMNVSYVLGGKCHVANMMDVMQTLLLCITLSTAQHCV